jgi:two-component system CheB/CheR fusion protein
MSPSPSEHGPASDAARLESELSDTRERLQATIEEYETALEELKSANEELISMNEETQSTNEELESSKEELQSLNEELITVNAELQGRIDELTRANDDMKNLLDSTDIATIFLDNQLRVRRFTPKATEIISLIPSDSGRPISHIVSNLEYTNLIDDAKEVIKSLIGKKIEVKTKTGQYYSMQITPYRTLTNVIDGVVITFQDTTELKQAEEKLENAYRMVEEQVRQQTKELYTANEQLKQEISKRKEADRDLSRLATVVKDSNDAITLQDRQGNILAWNFGAEQMYGYSEAEALKMNISDIVPEESRHETSDMIKKIFEGETIASFKTKRLTKDGRIIDVWLTVTIIKDEVGNPQTVATTERDLGKLNEKN